jgi:hypothetical protein
MLIRLILNAQIGLFKRLKSGVEYGTCYWGSQAKKKPVRSARFRQIRLLPRYGRSWF